MAPEPPPRAQGLLQVDPHTGAALAEGRAAERLLGHIDGESTARELHHREADALDRDAVSQSYIAEVEGAGIDRNAQAARHVRHGGDASDGLYDSCEHLAVNIRP